jgi:hypothetical protein
MNTTKSMRTSALAGFAPAGKPATRQERFCHIKSIVALRLAVAVAILSVSASWTAYGQTVVSATISRWK